MVDQSILIKSITNSCPLPFVLGVLCSEYLTFEFVQGPEVPIALHTSSKHLSKYNLAIWKAVDSHDVYLAHQTNTGALAVNCALFSPSFKTLTESFLYGPNFYPIVDNLWWCTSVQCDQGFVATLENNIFDVSEFNLAKEWNAVRPLAVADDGTCLLVDSQQQIRLTSIKHSFISFTDIQQKEILEGMQFELHRFRLYVMTTKFVAFAHTSQDYKDCIDLFVYYKAIGWKKTQLFQGILDNMWAISNECVCIQTPSCVVLYDIHMIKESVVYTKPSLSVSRFAVKIDYYQPYNILLVVETKHDKNKMMMCNLGVINVPYNRISQYELLNEEADTFEIKLFPFETILVTQINTNRNQTCKVFQIKCLETKQFYCK